MQAASAQPANPNPELLKKLEQLKQAVKALDEKQVWELLQDDIKKQYSMDPQERNSSRVLGDAKNSHLGRMLITLAEVLPKVKMEDNRDADPDPRPISDEILKALIEAAPNKSIDIYSLQFFIMTVVIKQQTKLLQYLINHLWDDFDPRLKEDLNTYISNEVLPAAFHNRTIASLTVLDEFVDKKYLKLSEEKIAEYTASAVDELNWPAFRFMLKNYLVLKSVHDSESIKTIELFSSFIQKAVMKNKIKEAREISYDCLNFVGSGMGNRKIRLSIGEYVLKKLEDIDAQLPKSQRQNFLDYYREFSNWKMEMGRDTTIADCLRRACEEANVTAVRIFLNTQEGRQSINLDGNSKPNALFCVSQIRGEAKEISAEARATVAKMLFAAGADLNAKNAAGQTPLMIAEQAGNVAVVEAIRKIQADHAKPRAPLKPLAAVSPAKRGKFSVSPVATGEPKANLKPLEKERNKESKRF